VDTEGGTPLLRGGVVLGDGGPSLAGSRRCSTQGRRGKVDRARRAVLPPWLRFGIHSSWLRLGIHSPWPRGRVGRLGRRPQDAGVGGAVASCRGRAGGVVVDPASAGVAHGGAEWGMRSGVGRCSGGARRWPRHGSGASMPRSIAGIRWWPQQSEVLGGGRQGVAACWASSHEGGLVVLAVGLAGPRVRQADLRWEWRSFK
jgi:hypothetical protein